MALYIPQSILHLARSLYVRPETYGPTYVVIQNAKGMRHIMFSSVACLFLLYFPHYPTSDAIFAKQTLLIFSTKFVWNISHSKTNQARYSHKVKWPSFFSDLTKTLISLKDFRKILKCQIKRKFVQCELSCSMRADGHTDEQIWRS